MGDGEGVLVGESFNGKRDVIRDEKDE